MNSSVLRTAGPILVTVAIGVLIAIQVGINVELGEALGHGIRSACWNFLSGSIILAPLSIRHLRDPQRHGTPLRELSAKVPLPLWFGGVLGAIFVAASILLSPVIGFSFFFLAIVVGQLASSVLLDAVGTSLGVPHRPLTRSKTAGLVLALVGVVALQLYRFLNPTDEDDESSTSDTHPGLIVTYALFAVGAGACLPVQAALNKGLSAYLRSDLLATQTSFCVGTIALVLASLITLAHSDAQLDSTHWYAWVGGFIAVSYVHCATVLPHVIGLAFFFLLIITGQLTAGLVLDHIGAFGVDERHISWIAVVAVVFTLAGASLVARSRSTGTSPHTTTTSVLPTSSSHSTDTDNDSPVEMLPISNSSKH